MTELHRVVRRPLVTEKSTLIAEGANKVVFEVDPGATKREIKEAVEELFRVTVLRVNTQRMRGKHVRVGRRLGRKPDWKKAVLTLKEGDRIEVLPNP